MKHTCNIGEWCGLCADNVRRGGSANHPSNLYKLPATLPIKPPSLTEPSLCIYRGEKVDSQSVSNAGYSPTRDHYRCKHIKPPEPTSKVERSLSLGIVSGCQTCGSQLPRAPFCGIGCEGYATEPLPSLPPEPFDPRNGLVIEQGAGGIGDGLLGWTAIARLAEEHPDTKITYRVSDLARPFLALFHLPNVTLGKTSKIHNTAPVAGAQQMNVGYFEQDAEWRNGSTQTRWERYAENIGGIGVIPTPPLGNPAYLRSLGKDCCNTVVLCPFSTDASRQWSVPHWLDLELRLHKAGYQTAVVHSLMEPLKPFNKSLKLAGVSAERLAGAMLNAVCVVGIDTGPPHLAGIMGVPTIVLGGSTPVEKIFGLYPRVRCIQGQLNCSACCGGYPADTACKLSCANLQSISPPEVLAAIDRIWLKETLTKDRSLVSEDRQTVIRDCVLATNHLPGVVAELGVYLGGTARLIGHYAPNARLRLFDTFQGIPIDDSEAGGHKAGDFPSDVEDVRRYLDNPLAEFFVGIFPHTLQKDDTTQHRFVHLDGDTYQSTSSALDWFGPRMITGGLIVLDDYGWHKCPGVAKALHERFDSKRISSPARHQAVVRF